MRRRDGLRRLADERVEAHQNDAQKLFRYPPVRQPKYSQRVVNQITEKGTGLSVFQLLLDIFAL